MALKKINVLLADAQPLTYMALKSLLENDRSVEVVGEVDDYMALEDALSFFQPDVLVMDHRSMDNFSVNAIGLLEKVAGQVAVLIISDDNHGPTIVQFLKIGIKGFLTKQCGTQEVLKAIKAIVDHQNFFCDKVLGVLLDQQEPQGVKGWVPSNKRLSQREVQVLQLIAEGFMTKQIAESLNLSPHTINTHRKNIIKKLGIKSPTEFVIHAIDLDLIQPGLKRVF